MAADLEGKRALVTGAARGLGLAIAELFVERGARVMLADRDEEEARSAAASIGDAAASVRCDVIEPEEVQAMVKATVDELGGIDVLVNNAGIEIAKPVTEHSDDEFLHLLKINVWGVFLCTKYALGSITQPGGSIVNLASVAGLGGAPLLSAYCASKAGVIGFTETCALELREAGVRANAICPAFIGTSMVERLLPIYDAALPVSAEELVAKAQGRLGEASEVAEMAAFLASDDASFVTGSHYVLDGGLTASLL